MLRQREAQGGRKRRIEVVAAIVGGSVVVAESQVHDRAGEKALGDAEITEVLALDESACPGNKGAGLRSGVMAPSQESGDGRIQAGNGRPGLCYQVIAHCGNGGTGSGGRVRIDAGAGRGTAAGGGAGGAGCDAGGDPARETARLGAQD